MWDICSLQANQIIDSVSVKNGLHMLQPSTQTQPTPTHTCMQTHMHTHTWKDTQKQTGEKIFATL